MISLQRFRDSRLMRGLAVLTLLGLGAELTAPSVSYALTGGPAQPEFNSFTPIGTSDMVNLSSGDFSYNIPLMDVGGYPLNLAYEGSPSMDQEASWVGLGWNLSVGQINRQVRGIPDDFKGDQIRYQNHQKKNVSIGGAFKVKPALFGADLDDLLNLSFGLGAHYNSYTGFSIKPSIGVALSLGGVLSLGMNAESGPDGLVLSPNVSISAKSDKENGINQSIGANFGVTFNSRQGLLGYNLSASLSASEKREANNKKGSRRVGVGGQSIGGSISFVNNTYTPQKRNAMQSESFTFNGSLGTEIFGVEADLQISGYGSYQDLAESEKNKTERSYGYLHTDLAGKEDVLDFNREKDGSLTINTTNLPLTNYTYDIYSVQGQGVGGMFRPYRSQVGYVYDPMVSDFANGNNVGVEIGMANTAHVGVDIKNTPSNSRSGVWSNSNTMISYLDEQTTGNRPDYEKAYFKNVGDLSADKEPGYAENDLHGYMPMRVGIKDDSQNDFNRYAKNQFEVKSDQAPSSWTEEVVNESVKREHRVDRNQAIQTFTKQEVLTYDLDNQTTILSQYAKDHHIAEIRITRNDGARYVYGKALYNTKKKEVSFSVSNAGSCINGLVSYTPGAENSVNNPSGKQYYNSVETPGYAHTYLLTEVFSTDYQDLTGDGPTDDDLGSYTKFLYDHNPATPSIDHSGGMYKWRVPFGTNTASYNEGLKTDPDDDQGNYVYGEKETAYIKQIITKTHVAVFHTSPRSDAYGVQGENGGLSAASKSYQLDSIQLFAKPEFYAPGATPIKTAHFRYNYSLCQGIDNGTTGKLTLDKVFFTYRNSRMGEYTPYEFVYSDFNPGYNLKGYDIWGYYKPNENATCSPLSPGDVPAPEFNYVNQANPYQDDWASAWALTRIKLPSGGVIKTTYESDDYQYVQDRKAMQMFKVHGAGTAALPVITANRDAWLSSNTAAYDYLYVKLPGAMTGTDFVAECLQPLRDKPVFFRFLLNMTKQGREIGGQTSQMDYVTGYFELDPSRFANVQVTSVSGAYFASVPVKKVDMEGGIVGGAQVNPVSKAGWHFARTYLTPYSYSLTGASTTQSFEGILTQMFGASVLQNLMEVFQGANGVLQMKGVAKRFIKERSFIRLMHPGGRKYGGGSRVKTIEMYDEWDLMTENTPENDANLLYKQKYGQEYAYTLTDGSSSGVATYEPVGSKENPFVQPVFASVKHLLAPDELNFIEGPFGESFFPSPTVTYSRVAVQNLQRETTGKSVRKHATGKVITEFYTSKDYPTLTDQMKLVAKEDKTDFFGSLLNLNVRKYLTMTQGYVIHLNDMNGKEKSQRVYAEGKDDFISGVDYIYGNLPQSGSSPASVLSMIKGRLDNYVPVILEDGSVAVRQLGVEYDVVNDFRENYSENNITGVNLNIAGMLFGVIPVIAPVPIPSVSKTSDRVRTVSTTKVINTFGILRETIAYDAGASVATKNLAWDAKTGEVLVTETTNEYNDKYYTLNYPAHWYYKGMGQAAHNIGLQHTYAGSGTNFYLTGGISDMQEYLNNGDQVWVTSSSGSFFAWVHGMTENTPAASFELLNVSGQSLNAGVIGTGSLKVVRSGRRNLQATSMGSMTLMVNPVDVNNDGVFNSITDVLFATTNWEEYRISNAGAVEFSDDWPPQCECGLSVDIIESLNPYIVNKRGVWRALKSWTHLTGRNAGTVEPTPRKEGFFSSYTPFYKPATGGYWAKDEQNWTFVSEVTKYSPYGFELENKDALNRYSAAQYGYNHTFPMAVGANTRYKEIGFDGFEEYHFDGCPQKAHFSFREGVTNGDAEISDQHFHTGKHSIKLAPAGRVSLNAGTDCFSE